jgi:diadenosine tetraphosphatase ApaH/serine/threonine PP2A family protein phosphatase
VICLGDLVGYGPDPAACTDLVLSRCRVVLRGDFEENLQVLTKGNTYARGVYDWIREEMGSRTERVATLPLRHTEGPDLFVHGSPRDPAHEYVLAADIEHGRTEKLEQIFAAFERRLFVGHTHLPGVITRGLTWASPSDMPGGRWVFDGAAKAIVNVGSIGKPLDQDNRACYVTLEGDAVAWHRIPYDHAATTRKIRAIPRLDDGLPFSRLERGC